MWNDVLDLITCYMASHRGREALACASEMCKKMHSCRSLTVSCTRLIVAVFDIFRDTLNCTLKKRQKSL